MENGHYQTFGSIFCLPHKSLDNVLKINIMYLMF
jgi:hypothetical protein